MAHVRQQRPVVSEKPFGLDPERRQSGIGERRIGDVGLAFSAKQSLRHKTVEPPLHEVPIRGADASGAEHLVEAVPFPAALEQACVKESAHRMGGGQAREAVQLGGIGRDVQVEWTLVRMTLQRRCDARPAIRGTDWLVPRAAPTTFIQCRILRNG